MSGFTEVAAVRSLDKTYIRAEIQIVFSQITIITEIETYFPK